MQNECKCSYKCLDHVWWLFLERRVKTVVFFHDETISQSNQDQSLQKGQRLRSQNAGVQESSSSMSTMVPNRRGIRTCQASEPLRQEVCTSILEYGENREGYWTRDKFIEQMKSAVEMART